MLDRSFVFHYYRLIQGCLAVGERGTFGAMVHLFLMEAGMEQFFARIDTELADKIRQRGYTIDQLKESGADDLRKEGFCTQQIDKIHSTLAELGLKPYGAERTSLSRSSVCADG